MPTAGVVHSTNEKALLFCGTIFTKWARHHTGVSMRKKNEGFGVGIGRIVNFYQLATS